jgi:O-antigen/teichoic acid export membrane protein
MLKKISLVFGSKVITSFGTILFVLVLNNYFGSATTGLYMTFISACLGLSLLCKFGSELYLIKNCAIAIDEEDYVSFWHMVFKVLLFVFINTLLVLFVAIFIIYISIDIDLINLTKSLVYILPLFNFLAVGSAILRAVNKAELALFFEIGSITFIASCLLMLSSNLSLEVREEEVLEFILYSCLILIVLLFILIYKYCPKAGLNTPKSSILTLDFIKVLPNFFNYNI